MKLDLAKTRDMRLLVATHTHGSFVPAYVQSLAQLTGQLAAWGIQHAVAIVEECFVEVGRDKAAALMLREGFTHLLFIDADIAFEPGDVAALIAADKPLVAGAYRVKSDRGGERYALRMSAGGDCTTNWDADAQAFEADGVGTGFMLIRREVFERMREAMPELAHRDEGADQELWAFFELFVKDGVRVGEDYRFCQRWRDLGGKVWVMPGLDLRHYGRSVWRGRMADTIPTLSAAPVAAE
ncbi:hypothetical protein [Tropicimonas marinistellae]|uniref:hypothetical protein n=1 Tax=Tropicimonas marinistellae TaxID=1739787 RepID=UPI00083697AD|nr:hypothetical protein [Tropicimonas marinistellae]